MVRPPCCDKGGVKKGPWTPEEDIILVTYIQEHGPGNWRAVPTNTDNDIKNYWNTHLKKKLNKANQDSHQELDQSRDRSSLSSSPSSSSANSNSNISRGQWERRLQTDIHLAKKALSEALSPAVAPIATSTLATTTTSSSAESRRSTSSACGFLRTQETSTTYASSTENIAKLLKGWVKNSPKTQNSPDQMVSPDSESKDVIKSDVEKDCLGAFQTFSGFDHLKDCDSSYDQGGVSPDHETKPDITGCSNQSQWSLFEKWLFEDSGGQIGDILLDENPNFF
ncbi:unnamed protein product [Thlaspi arvense]|uniref:Myb-like domain-containing protein n=1 Tax=Thlaspi arvense TaxID=13288 RepID=A0AAU9RQP9_THLAR|nr:unnamed protein product [Thlaspi arvense]